MYERESESHHENEETLKISLDNLKVCSLYEKNGWVKTPTPECCAKEPYALYRKD